MKSEMYFDYENLIVVKTVNTKEEYDREMLVYGRHFSFVPEIINRDDELSFSMEMIQGHHISEGSDYHIIGEHFSQLHSVKSGDLSLCHQDTNPKNYMYSLGEYYFIDFAESGFNYPEFDLIHFLLFWAEIADSDAFKIIINSLIEGYSRKGKLVQSRWIELFPQIVQMFDDRRQMYNKPNIISENTLTNRKLVKSLNL